MAEVPELPAPARWSASIHRSTIYPPSSSLLPLPLPSPPLPLSPLPPPLPLPLSLPSPSPPPPPPPPPPSPSCLPPSLPPSPPPLPPPLSPPPPPPPQPSPSPPLPPAVHTVPPGRLSCPRASRSAALGSAHPQSVAACRRRGRWRRPSRTRPVLELPQPKDHRHAVDGVDDEAIVPSISDAVLGQLKESDLAPLHLLPHEEVPNPLGNVTFEMVGVAGLRRGVETSLRNGISLGRSSGSSFTPARTALRQVGRSAPFRSVTAGWHRPAATPLPRAPGHSFSAT